MVHESFKHRSGWPPRAVDWDQGLRKNEFIFRISLFLVPGNLLSIHAIDMDESNGNANSTKTI